MLLHKLVQGGDGVQLPAGDLLAVRVQPPGCDLSAFVQNQLVGEAVVQHVGVIVGVVIGEDQRLFALGKIECVADHLGLAVVAGGLAPHVADIHQHVAVGVAAVHDFPELVRRHHEVIQALLLAVAVKSQLGIGDDGVKEEMLDNAVIGLVFHAVPLPALGHDGGVENLIGRLLRRNRFGFGLRFRFRRRLLGGLRWSGLVRRGRLLLDRRGSGCIRCVRCPAAGAGGCEQKRQGQQQRGELFHVYSTSWRRFIPPFSSLSIPRLPPEASQLFVSYW